MNVLKNCPSIYYANCINAGLKCKSCFAGTSNNSFKLLYSPIEKDEDLLVHPAQQDSRDDWQEKHHTKNKKQIDKVKSTLVKKALKKESTVCQSIADEAGVFFIPTIASGRVKGDGDGTIGGISVDHKYRTTSNSFTVTRSEYTKGIAQGVQAWVVTNVNDKNKDETCVVLTKETFIQLLQDANAIY